MRKKFHLAQRRGREENEERAIPCQDLDDLPVWSHNRLDTLTMRHSINPCSSECTPVCKGVDAEAAPRIIHKLSTVHAAVGVCLNTVPPRPILMVMHHCVRAIGIASRPSSSEPVGECSQVSELVSWGDVLRERERGKEAGRLGEGCWERVGG